MDAGTAVHAKAAELAAARFTAAGRCAAVKTNSPPPSFSISHDAPAAGTAVHVMTTRVKAGKWLTAQCNTQ